MLKNSLIISILVCILSQVLGFHTPTVLNDDLKTGISAKVGKKLYYFGETKVSWFKANVICRDMGGYLASFDNQQELAALSDHLKANYPTDRWWWVSSSDVSGRGDFVWYPTGIAYTDWSAGQPINTGNTNSCVHLWYTNSTRYQMKNWNCYKPAYYICEDNPPKTVILS